MTTPEPADFARQHGAQKGKDMGIDTKILLTKAPDILDILRFATERWQDVKLSYTPAGFYWLEFMDGRDQRQLSVSPPERCASDYADVHVGPAVYMSMGCWGNSEAIARRFAVHFGGMIMPNDCTDDWQNVHGEATNEPT